MTAARRQRQTQAAPGEEGSVIGRGNPKWILAAKERRELAVRNEQPRELSLGGFTLASLLGAAIAIVSFEFMCWNGDVVRSSSASTAATANACAGARR